MDSAMPVHAVNDIAAILAEVEMSGFISTNKTKKLAEFQSPVGQIIYVVKTTSKMNSINVMVHPGLKPEFLRLLGGVSSVSNEYRYHSNMTRFPKRLNKGQNETAYGWQVNIDTLEGLAHFLKEFKVVSF